MYCKKCGAMIDDNATFCKSCGASQDAIVAVGGQPVAPKQQEKELLLQQMNGSFQIMSALKNAEDELEAMEEQMTQLEAKASNSSRNKLIILGVFLTAFMGLGLILIIYAFIRQNKNKQKLAEYQQQMQAKQNALETLKNDAALVWLPYNYRNSTAFAMMYGYLTNMRANNLTEAINLLETEMHQARVELLSSISAQASIDAADAAHSAAGAAGAAAFFSLFK